MSVRSLPRLDLAQLPTPVHRLARLTAELGGPELWIKRDDLTGLAMGGNKVRKLEWAGDGSLNAALQAEADRTTAAGRQPYIIPVGGSNPLGAAAYAYAVQELLAQEVLPDRIVVASSSGGTLAGLLAGAQLFGYSGKLTGIRIAKFGGAELGHLASLAHGAAGLIGQPIELSEDDIDLRQDYMEPGYGILTELERRAIQRFARREGILLDPVYTGRAAGGMLDLIVRRKIGRDEQVLFWHTGGTPALFAYGDRLAR